MEIIQPHGGVLINRIADEKQRQLLEDKLHDMPKLRLDRREMSDLEMLSIGAFSPLEGFMGQEDYECVVHEMCLTNGLPWTIPITLSVTKDQTDSFDDADELALCNQSGDILGVLYLESVFEYDEELEARLVYKTTDDAHPGVKALYQQGELLLSGKVELSERNKDGSGIDLRYYLDPCETRALFAEKGWRRIVAFQTRNPIHRAHEYLQKCALETVDGLLIHPLVGETKKDDVPAAVRMKCYETVIDKYYPADRAVLSVLPAAMRYAGPREAIFHAIMRKNYGCTHFIVGRDHAGIGDYYGTYDAQRIFDEFDTAKLGIVPVFFEHAFYCRKCGQLASKKTCPHSSEAHVYFSGTKVRKMLRAGQSLPPEFTRVEVAQILMDWADQVKGKSTR